MTPLLKLLAEFTEMAERGEVVAASIQYIKPDGSMWFRGQDGDMRIPVDMQADAEANYARLTGKGN